MKLQSLQRHFNCIAKQAGVMPTSWFAINSLSSDRTPEGYNARGSVDEGWDG